MTATAAPAPCAHRAPMSTRAFPGTVYRCTCGRMKFTLLYGRWVASVPTAETRSNDHGDWPMVRALLDEYSAAELYRLTDILAGIEHEAVEVARRPRV